MRLRSDAVTQSRGMTAQPRNRATAQPILILTFLLAIAIALAITFGSVPLDWDDETARMILLRLRLPRVLLAAAIGATLAVAGVTFQTLLRNPLADPFILGVSGGAACGAAVA